MVACRSPRSTASWPGAMEPRASTPERRIDAIRQLSPPAFRLSLGSRRPSPASTITRWRRCWSGRPTPARVGAYYTTLRLPLEIKHLFREWLAAERPTVPRG